MARVVLVALQMTLTARFLAYIAAYERSYGDDDWTRLEPFFSEDAVHEVSGGSPLGGHWQGRNALIANLRQRAESFDRRFDGRVVGPRGMPVQMGDAVALPWRAVYRLNRAPRDVLKIEGTQVASYSKDQIKRLRDQLRPRTDRLIRNYLQRHMLIGGKRPS